MAGKGRVPSVPADRQARPNRVPPSLEIEADGTVYGFDLPEFCVFDRDGEAVEWPEPTKHWWETMRRCAQAHLFIDTDWSFLLDTALLHAQMWRGDLKMAAEVRLRVVKFGVTPEDRARLRLDVKSPAQRAAQAAEAHQQGKEAGKVADMSERRAALGK